MKEISMHFTSVNLLLEAISLKLYERNLLGVRIILDDAGYIVEFTYMS